MQQITLRTHARYSREEALAALGYASFSRRPAQFREGVVWVPSVQTDAFFVTLQKTEQGYSPTTMYKDYAISPELFHWESQNTTRVSSATGQRYLNHHERGSHVLLLARPTKRNEWAGPEPYRCLGPATYVSHEGEQPIAITWKLRHPMTVDLFRQASLTA